jgi:RNA polymerase sigma-70 factor (ECF subfamily)
MVNETLLDIAMSHADRLILQAQSGNEQAFNKLVSLWYKRIYNYAYKYAGSHDMAMDITQNTFIAVHHKINQLRDVNSFKPWLYRIAINCSHEELRKQRRISGISIDSTVNEDGEERKIQIEDDLRYQPDAKLQRQELAELILSSLQTLSEEQRLVVIMKEYEGLKFREIAEALDISENTAKSRLYYGLKHLRSKLSNLIYENQTVES